MDKSEIGAVLEFKSMCDRTTNRLVEVGLLPKNENVFDWSLRVVKDLGCDMSGAVCVTMLDRLVFGIYNTDEELLRLKMLGLVCAAEEMYVRGRNYQG